MDESRTMKERAPRRPSRARQSVLVAALSLSLVGLGAGTLPSDVVGSMSWWDRVLYDVSGGQLGQSSESLGEEDLILEQGVGYDADTGTEFLSNGEAVEHEDPVTAEQLEQMQVSEPGSSGGGSGGSEGNGSSSQIRLVIDSVGIDARLREMQTYTDAAGQRVIAPPTSENPYVVRDWGTADRPEDGMLVIAMHSLRGYDVPGSRLIDIDSARARVSVGDTVQVAGNTYRITSTGVVDKGALASDSSVWDDADGKLLLITCLQREQGRSVQNIVVEAQLVR